MEPDKNSIFLFCGKRCDRIKILFWEPAGYLLMYRRLEVVCGRYRWPTARANGLNPLKYLEFLLDARPNHKMSEKELEKLMPWSDTVQECCINKSE